MPTTHQPNGILSDPSRRIGDVHHPWRILRDRLPDWDVVFKVMPAGILGETNMATRQISLDSQMLQVQRRTCLDHELHHALAGDDCRQHPKREARINQSSARRLIPMSRLIEAVKWTSNTAELADELFVDVATLKCRVEHLTPYERAVIRDVLAARDNTEETA